MLGISLSPMAAKLLVCPSCTNGDTVRKSGSQKNRRENCGVQRVEWRRKCLALHEEILSKQRR